MSVPSASVTVTSAALISLAPTTATVSMDTDLTMTELHVLKVKAAFGFHNIAPLFVTCPIIHLNRVFSSSSSSFFLSFFFFFFFSFFFFKLWLML